MVVCTRSEVKKVYDLQTVAQLSAKVLVKTQAAWRLARQGAVRVMLTNPPVTLH